MDIEQFMPNAVTVAAIEKDVATYNKRRAHEAARLSSRRPAVITIYVIVILVLAYGLYSAAGSVIWLHYVLVVVGIGFFPRLDKWMKGDAAWTQQRFRDHILPVMFGFIPDFRYSHGGTPGVFERIPREMLPTHNERSFDDIMSGTLEGGRILLFEMKLVQRSKNSETVQFQGAVLHCRLRSPFPGTLLATRKIGGVARFFRDLFGSTLSQIVAGDRRLDDLYEFRTDRRSDARRLLAGPLGGMLSALWREWPGDTAQVGIRDEDVFLLLPTSNNFFELPPIDAEICYRNDLVPMMRQIARFLSIAALAQALDGTPPASADVQAPDEPPSEADAGPPTVPEACSSDDTDFVPLLDPVEPPPAPVPPRNPEEPTARTQKRQS